MTPASASAKQNPHSTLRRYFDTAIEQVRTFLEFMDEISMSELQSFWGRR